MLQNKAVKMIGIEYVRILDENALKEQLNSTICRHFALATLEEHAMLKEWGLIFNT